MNVAHQLHIVVVVVDTGYIVRFVVVVCPNVNDNKICGLLCLEVPFRRIFSVDLGSPRGCIANPVPLVYLVGLDEAKT